MVFRGKPSKACVRCRARRLKCDLKPGSCSSCMRANTLCLGYRDTQQLRIRDESKVVARRAMVAASTPGIQEVVLSIEPQARDTFFASYATSLCLDSLKTYYHPVDSPTCLTLAIEAVSLAYFWYQVRCDSILSTARQKYVLALRTTNRTLESLDEATRSSTLHAAVLLDLFEKVTDNAPTQSVSRTGHLNGGLALVKFRGLEHFTDPTEINILIRLFSHTLMNCITLGLPISAELETLQAYIEKQLLVPDPTFVQRKLAGQLPLMNIYCEYAKLCSSTQRSTLTTDDAITMTMELDMKLQKLAQELPSLWRYSTVYLEGASDRVLGNLFHSYSGSKVCQGWNFFRVIRILLNESLLEYYATMPTDDCRAHRIQESSDLIEAMVKEICASVPQYTDCTGAAKYRSSSAARPNPDIRRLPTYHHSHTSHEQLNCYAVVFPLYVAAQAQTDSETKTWILSNLYYISDHFHNRNALVVARLVEEEADISPWTVFAMLGSYACI